MSSWFDIMYEDPVPLGEHYPMFNRVSLETSAYCNRSCSFCPISTGRRPKQRLMEQALLDKVLGELAELEFDGILSAFLLNEPTMNKRYKDELRQMRATVPNSCIYVSTNADVLKTGDDLWELFAAGATCVNLNIYDGGEEQAERLWALANCGVESGHWRLTNHKYQRHSPRKKLVAVTDMRPERLTASATDLFYDRTKEERPRGGVPQRYCARPHRHIVILHDGNVPLCCALDPTDPDLERDGLMVGSVARSTIRELWDSETMFMYRWRLQQQRRDLPGCSTCTHRMSYSHVVRRVTADPATLERWRVRAEAPLLTIG